MATSLKFDELNRLDYRDYFGGMFISPKQMRRRIELAEEIEDVIFFLFAYWAISADAEIPVEEIKQDAKTRLTSVVEKRLKLDPYIEKRINDVIDEVVDATERHKATDTDINAVKAEKSATETDNPSYWTSRERAMVISANEANAFENYNDYKVAKASGKTKKRWITELDDKVRFTHELVEGETVDIDGLFLVGESMMRFPKDTEYDPDPQEIVNCRCSVEYL